MHISNAYEICILHMHIMYAHQKCKSYVHQVSITYVTIYAKVCTKRTATQQGSAYTTYARHNTKQQQVCVYSTKQQVCALQ